MRKSYTVVKNIKRKGFPTESKFYKEAHAEANIAEKEKFPTGYSKLKKLDNSLSEDELIGKNTSSGKIFVSKKVPKKYRAEVAFHEKFESSAIKRMKKKNK